ncbi:NAD-dependent epimerase/dehydratase family protein [Pseudonocardia sp. KRD-184]|uniref:NAD-dependent epimerase/dehydratase family protein n=1 Tax=Pseudonocardia oceani TaxID=2792013 RepID=A0ABS6U7H9_9PSEU|nr:NAD-dependent epimerase/dehydratase family protein [Pseudonocardia oceani]MBW0093923.1 NAD-dependent epimerase/dehydratase family protein [Pseudonocardia oceani]MBW0100492.1 NAD-dependent epimerase/dehydratase family protein [Pseudonocardia oceani]MBW0112241.1 NAD-dependent epimerase/dehydratase family protein [Pseudonocardia oceani]MBW0125565.1 NAD-dependent epimerase/dehydratase family protein [Pseudonocardia oceani]MBW0128177.1 NAD-dependent epimerase/dehydratase family protein [Pseudono
MTPSVVLVTGVSRFLGGHLAARLAANPDIDRVLGVDTVPPPRDLLRRMGRAEFVRADIRNPLISKVIEHASVDTVVHASLSANPGSAGGRATMKEMNVIGTMQLLAACQKAPSVQRMVLKSTTAVYGSSPRDPALFDETTTPKDLPSGGYAKDAVEIEGYLRGFGRRRPDVSVTVLRFSNFIGPRIDTVLTRYFALPVIPTVLGYDARVQLLHEEDALAVLERATSHDLSGVYNVAADGVLLLSQAIRRAGRVPLPVPSGAVGPVSRIFRGARLVDFSPEQMRFLNFGRVVDTGRLRSQFGFTPRWTTTQAFDDYVRGRALRPVVSAESIETVERGVLAAARTLR